MTDDTKVKKDYIDTHYLGTDYKLKNVHSNDL